MDRHSKATIDYELDRMDLQDERDLNQTLTAQLLEQREQIARLREACEFALAKAEAEWDAVNRHPGSHHAEYVEVLSAALTDTADDWLSAHDAEVRREERKRINFAEDLKKCDVAATLTERERCAVVCDAVEQEMQDKLDALKIDGETVMNRTYYIYLSARNTARRLAAAMRPEDATIDEEPQIIAGGMDANRLRWA